MTNHFRRKILLTLKIIHLYLLYVMWPGLSSSRVFEAKWCYAISINVMPLCNFGFICIFSYLRTCENEMCQHWTRYFRDTFQRSTLINFKIYYTLLLLAYSILCARYIPTYFCIRLAYPWLLEWLLNLWLSPWFPRFGHRQP